MPFIHTCDAHRSKSHYSLLSRNCASNVLRIITKNIYLFPFKPAAVNLFSFGSVALVEYKNRNLIRNIKLKALEVNLLKLYVESKRN